MKRARVYRNIDRTPTFFGLEPLDAVAAGGVLWLLVLTNPHALGWNLLCVLVLTAGVRVAKRGRPEGYTLAAVRFHLARRPFYSAAVGEDREGQ
jgi:hypothetical protein